MVNFPFRLGAGLTKYGLFVRVHGSLPLQRYERSVRRAKFHIAPFSMIPL